MSLKSDFPIFANNPGMVYLDSAASLQKPAYVIDHVSHYLAHDYANIHRGWYELSEKSELYYRQARQKVATLLQAKEDEIFFTASATDGINKLIQSMVFSGILTPDDTVLLSDVEHHANIVAWQRAALQYGFSIDFVGLTADYTIDIHDLLAKLTPSVKIVSFTMVSNVTGFITDIATIKTHIQAQPHPPLFILDASQAVPHIYVDAHKTGADFLFFTGHKLGAHTGIGVVWGKREYRKQLKPTFGGGGMVDVVTRAGHTLQPFPDAFEAGTPNLVGAMSLKATIEYMESVGESVVGFYTKLQSIEKPLMEYCQEQFTYLADQGIRLVGNQDLTQKISVFSFQLPAGKHATKLGQYMASKHICIRCGAQCAHIFHAGLPHAIDSTHCMQHTCRISLWGYNDIDDIVIFFDALRSFLAV